ncbi:MAG: phosphate/phosphite/phosphonate ABC transporter substrate-binding protein [Verrucomicrobiota bacterium]|nr:phosphate/phosphite/phosphonate ABC transporter substrate-binding protein [Verrucomicrobiota bacterium]
MIQNSLFFCPWIFRLVFCLLTIAMVSCGDSNHSIEIEEYDNELSLKKVIIALKANKQPASMLVEKQDLENYLSTKLDRPVEVIIPSDSSVVVESFRNGTLDLGYLSSTDAARNLSQETADILLVHLKNGKPHYKSIWLTKKEKTYQSIDELKGKPVAFASRSSTSGFLIPTWDMMKRGLVGNETSLTDFFSLTLYGTGYVSAVEKVLSGEVEAAAVSDYVYRGDNKYLDDTQKERLRVFQEQGPVPAHTLCVRSTMSEKDRKIIKEALLQMNEDNADLRDRIFNGKLISVVADEHLKVTREALEFQKKLKP